MKQINKFLLVLISVAFVFQGVIAQFDAAPTSSQQLIESILNDGRDPALVFGPQDKDLGDKPAYVKPSSTDALFDLQFSWPVGVGGGEAGIETDGNYIYSTKWNGTGEFYRYGMDGTYIEVITVTGAAAIRDLAYDGTYFYGAAANATVRQLDLANATLISSFTAPAAIRAIAYNEDDNVFYGNNWSEPIQVFDPAGASQGSFTVGPGAASIYGLAYDNYCGGQYLWAYAQPGTTPATQNVLFQIALPSGVETGVTFDVATVVTPVTGIAGGLCITDEVVPGYWTIMGMMQNEFIWGLELCSGGPLPTVDVGIMSIVEPSSGIGLSNAEPVTVSVKNFGTAAQSNFDVYYTLDGGPQIIETISATINAGETYDHTFATTVDLSAVGMYDIDACTMLAGDENTANDCKTKTVENSEPSTSFCAPTFTTGCDVGDGLSDFAVEQIQNLNNGCANNTGLSGWSEYYGLGPALLLPGVTHTFTVGTGFVNQYVNIWIDFNDDMVLTMDEMILADYWMQAVGVLYDVDVEIPASATPGPHAMRAMAVYASTFTDPCGSYSWGEAEDYSVVIGIPAYGDLEGYVTENESGLPIDGATVSVGGFATGTSGSDGYYLIEDVLVGTWDATASKDNYHPETVSVTIVENITTVQDFELVAPGTLEGVVTELGSSTPIQGAMIDVGGMYSMMTGADGSYMIEDILTGTYDVTCTKEGYNPEMATVIITEGDVIVQDFALAAPQAIVSPLSVEVTMDPNSLLDDLVNISNPGNGTVNWGASVIIADNSEDAWDLQFTFDVTAATGAAGNAGAECDGQYYYTTRWASNLLHKYDLDGNLIEEFSIPGVTGLRDLAFDGTYMYGGAAGAIIYQMDFTSQTLVSSISNAGQARNIAYDAEFDAFWVANFGSDILLISKTGATLNTIPLTNINLSGMYGSAYDNTSGTPYLWMFAQGGGAGTPQLIHQIDLTTKMLTGFNYDVLADLGPNASAIAGGLFMVDNVYPGFWSIGGLLQGTPDAFFMYEYAPAGPLWLTIDPTSGTLNGGEDEDITLSFNTFDLLPGDYFAEIQFSTTPNVGEPVVDVTLHVAGLVPAINLELDYTCTDVLLDWEMPAGGTPDSWNIYRDNTLIGNATVMMYTDEMVDPEVEYGYYIKAVYLGVESMPTATQNITVPTPDELEASGLTATSNIPNENDVTLSWDEPDCCVTPDGYNVYRDGSMINTALVTALTYVDPSLPPGFYEYYVVAVYYFGESDESNPAYTLITGINELDASSFRIQPNPATDYITVQADYVIESYELLNNTGQLVKTSTVNTKFTNIDVSQFESGIYYIRLITAEGTSLNKVAIR